MANRTDAGEERTTSVKIVQTNDQRVIVDSPFKGSTDVLVITPTKVSVADRGDIFPLADSDVTETIDAFGFIGVINLAFARYVLVATKRVLTATIQAHKVWKITGTAALFVGPTEHSNDYDSKTDPTSLLSVVGASAKIVAALEAKVVDEQGLAKIALDKELLDGLQKLLNSGNIFYCENYDLTMSVQHNLFDKCKEQKPAKTVLDDRYHLNRQLQSVLFQNEGCAIIPAFSPWEFKAILGFVGSIEVLIPLPDDKNPEITVNHKYMVTLISRISTRRLGTRYVLRGLDMNGNAANSVEMEQIVFHNDFRTEKFMSSFVQVRGSAPAIWTQTLDLSYRPNMTIANTQDTPVWNSIAAHLSDLRDQYVFEKGWIETMPNGEESDADDSWNEESGKVICVNLLDDKGFEGPLTRTYADVTKRFSDSRVQYEEFPVNKYCKKMNFRNMEILTSRVRERLNVNGFFVGEGEVTSMTGISILRPRRLQTGLARVSCLDSLDRTNLTCTLFARHVLPYQISAIVNHSAGVADDSPTLRLIRKVLQNTAAPSPFTSLWADSGDSISILYAGTRALKGDVTRTGQRQWLTGSVDDGMNAVTRYYLNNFTDGHKQDIYDLVSGQADPSKLAVLAQTEGIRRARHLQRPILPQPGDGSLLSAVVPAFVIKIVEPFLQNAREFARDALESHVRKPPPVRRSSFGGPKVKREHVDDDGTPLSYVGLAVTSLKLYAPSQVVGLLQFTIAMIVFFYILVLVKVFGVPVFP
ncbi:SacI homology domain-containing protein [Cladochytrium replicatum]|nr:SacI homology domain-containing protein [Cladochytrium replicatum]